MSRAKAKTKTRKPTRPYDSTRRQAQARETRRQIIEAARKLFADHGYAGATIDAIAQEAGVAPETVFASFGNKRTILANLIGSAVGGDDRPVTLLERPGPQAVLTEPDPARQIRLFSDDMADILERVAPVFDVMRVASKTEPDIALLLKNMLAERLQTLSAVVQSLASHGGLREGLDETTASETLWAITSPELFTLLTVDRGWAKERYAHWLHDSLARLLLR